MIANLTGVDLGHGHTLLYLDWFAALVTHMADGGQMHFAVITFADEPQASSEPGQTRWFIETPEPLTIVPSIDCYCGDRGFIDAGRWQPA